MLVYGPLENVLGLSRALAYTAGAAIGPDLFRFYRSIGERGDVTKGEVRFKGERVDQLTPNELVRRGLSQVMEARHCFGHLTIEENLLVGAYTRRLARADLNDALDTVYRYFPRLKERRASQAGYTSGGEQQMCAIGRALMAKPSMILLDEPSMGIAPRSSKRSSTS
jgi:branched-chain amino acid transport system ATP-binding protein